MKTILTICFVLILNFNSNAQYRFNKEKYNSKEYTYQPGDPYNPLICGAVSYFMPGLGQMVAGETGRGLVFTGAFFGSVVVAGVGAIGTLGNTIYKTNNGATALLVVGATGAITTMIWSIVDAVKVTKVNNLAFRDKRRASYNLDLQPVFISNEAVVGQSVGLKLRVRF